MLGSSLRVTVLLAGVLLLLSAPSADAQRRMGGMMGMPGSGGGGGGGGGGGQCRIGFDGCFNRCLMMGGTGTHTPAAGCSGRCGRACSGGMVGPHEPGRGQP